MTQIPSAVEARATVDNGTSEKARVEWEQIATKINQAIQNGQTSITVSQIMKGNQTKLEALGYKIVSGGRYNEVDYGISW